MKFFHLTTAILLTLAALPACSTPDVESVGEDQEAIMIFNDPNAIVDAIKTAGTTFSSNRIKMGGVRYYCVLTAGVWSLSSSSGDTISLGAFNQLAQSTVDNDPQSESFHTIAMPAGRFRLDEVGTTCNPVDYLAP